MYISSAQLELLTSSSAWLTDDIIDAAQSMLSRSFPQIDSPQSVCLLEVGKAQATVGTPSADWVQIIRINHHCHWIPISNLMSCHPNATQAYVSMISSAAGKDLQRVLALLSFSLISADSIVIQHMNYQHQIGGDDWLICLCHNPLLWSGPASVTV